MRKLISLALALVMSLALAAPAAAANVGTSGNTGSVPVTISAEATAFSVSVPTSIPLHVAADATVTCADNLSIQNSSAGPVEVSGIKVQNGTWSIVSFNDGNRSALAAEKVNAKKLGIAFTPDGGTQTATSSEGTQDLALKKSEWVIDATSSLPFECDAIATAVSTEASVADAASVVFTLAWYEAPDPSVHNGIIPEGGVYVAGGKTYTAGQEFPEGKYGTYTYGDYLYTCDVGYDDPETGEYRYGWRVRIRDEFLPNISEYDYHTIISSKTEFGELLSEINGAPLVDISWLFYKAQYVEHGPTVIPATVKCWYLSFVNCPNLTGTITSLFPEEENANVDAGSIYYYYGESVFSNTKKPIILLGNWGFVEEADYCSLSLCDDDDGCRWFLTKGNKSDNPDLWETSNILRNPDPNVDYISFSVNGIYFWDINGNQWKEMYNQTDKTLVYNNYGSGIFIEKDGYLYMKEITYDEFGCANVEYESDYYAVVNSDNTQVKLTDLIENNGIYSLNKDIPYGN